MDDLQPVYFGAWLVFAALTGVCALAAILSLAALSWWCPVWVLLTGMCLECHIEAGQH